MTNSDFTQEIKDLLKHPKIQEFQKQFDEAMPEEAARIKALSPEELTREITQSLKHPKIQALLKQIEQWKKEETNDV